jgi:hypothetical protein
MMHNVLERCQLLTNIKTLGEGYLHMVA